MRHPADSTDPLGYAAPWHPVGDLPGWVYAPTFHPDPWGDTTPVSLSFPVVSFRVGTKRSGRRTSWTTAIALPAWAAEVLAAVYGRVDVVDVRAPAMTVAHTLFGSIGGTLATVQEATGPESLASVLSAYLDDGPAAG